MSNEPIPGVFIELAYASNALFPGSSKGDVCIRPVHSSQSILLGTDTYQPATFALSGSNILMRGSVGLGGTSNPLEALDLRNGNAYFDSNVYVMNYVGIGSTHPSEALHVVSGNSKLDSNLYVLGEASIGVSDSNPTETLDVNSNIKVRSNAYVLSRIAIGSSNPTETLDVIGNAKITNNLYSFGSLSIGTSNPKESLDVLSNTILRSNVYVMRKMAIGSSNPSEVLDVQGNTKVSGLLYVTSSVGIGNSNPTERLDVTFNTKMRGNVYALSNMVIGNGASNPTEVLDVRGNAKVSQNLYVTNNVAVGSSNPTEKVDIVGNTKVQGNLYTTNRIAVGNSNPGEKIDVSGNILASGNVYAMTNLGVGTALPSERVEVTGNIKSLGNVYAINNVSVGHSNPVEKVDVIGNIKVSSNVYVASKVGVNTTSPQVGLEVNTTDSILVAKGTTAQRPSQPTLGHIRYNIDTNQFEGYGACNTWSAFGVVKSANQQTYISVEEYPSSNDDNIKFINSNLESMRITRNRQVGINTSNPTERLEIVGNIKASSNMYVMSKIGVNTSNPAQAVHVIGNVRVEGNLDVMGIYNSISTDVQVTDQFTVSNNGTGPALNVYQMGAQPVADFYDDTVIAMRIADGGSVGINTSNPTERLHVQSGKIYSTLQHLGNSNDSAILPSFSFKEDSNTGLYHASNATIGFTTAGVEKMRINSNGQVGIGTATPLYKLDVAGQANVTYTGATASFTVSNNSSPYIQVIGASNSVLTLGASGSAGTHSSDAIGGDVVIKNQQSTTSGRLLLQAGNGASGICINSNNTVGIGTSAPVKGKLEVNGVISSYASGGGEARYHLFNGGGIAEWKLGQKSGTSHNFTLSKSVNSVDSDYLTIDTNGNVGIGTSPSYPLDVNGTGKASLLITPEVRTVAGPMNLKSEYDINYTADYDGNNGGAQHIFYSYSNEKVRITQTGNIGIGTTTPNERLHVIGGKIYSDTQNLGSSNDSASIPSFSFKEESNTGFFHASNSAVGITTNGSEKMRIDYLGNVGIGIMPTYKLDVNGTTRIKSSNTQALMVEGSNGWTSISFSNNVGSLVDLGLPHTTANLFFTNGTYSNDFVIRQNATGGRVLLNNGGTFGGICLNSNNTVGIGTSTPMYTLDVVGNINSTANITGPTITSLSNLGVFSSNTAISASNTTIALSNYVYGTNTTNITYAQTTANWASNAGLFGSNTAVSTSNTTIALSNYVYGTNATNINNAQTTANWASNAGLFSSNNITGITNTKIVTSNVGVGTLAPVEKLQVIGGKMHSDAQILGTSNDSASVPSHSFKEESNVGMFHASNSSLGFSTAGIERIRISDTGYVGVGSSNPIYPLDVSGKTRFANQVLFNSIALQDTILYVRTSNDGNHVLSYASTPVDGPFLGGAGGVKFGRGNNGNPIIDMVVKSGSVGIGTTTPGYTLDVNGTINSTGTITGPTVTSLSNLGVFGSNTAISASNTVVSLSNYVYGPNTTNNSNSQFTANWASNTAVSASNTTISLSNYVYGTNTINITNAQTTANWASNAGLFGSNTSVWSSNLLKAGWSNNSSYLYVGAGSNIGIGTSTPAYRLDISGTVRATNSMTLGQDLSLSSNNAAWPTTAGRQLYMRYSTVSGQDAAYVQSIDRSTNTYYNLGIEASNIALGGSNSLITPAIYAQYGGNVGIGTTTPSYKLDVNGTINATTYSNVNYVNLTNLPSQVWRSDLLGTSIGRQGYFKIATLLDINAGANGTCVNIRGWAGTFGPKMKFECIVSTRSGVNMKAYISGAVYDNATDIVLYQETDNTFSLYFWNNNYYSTWWFEVSANTSYGASLLVPSSTTYTPTGTLSTSMSANLVTVATGTSFAIGKSNPVNRFEVDATSGSQYGTICTFTGSNNISTVFAVGDVAGRYNNLAKIGDTIIVGINNNAIDSGGMTVGPWTGTYGKGIRIDGPTGFVGVGTSNPLSKFHVDGGQAIFSQCNASVWIGSASNAGSYVSFQNSNMFISSSNWPYYGIGCSDKGIVNVQGYYGLRMGDSGNTTFFISGNKVGIGISNPSYLLDVNGPINSTGNLTGPTITSLSNLGIWSSNNLYNKTGGAITGNMSVYSTEYNRKAFNKQVVNIATDNILNTSYWYKIAVIYNIGNIYCKGTARIQGTLSYIQEGESFDCLIHYSTQGSGAYSCQLQNTFINTNFFGNSNFDIVGYVTTNRDLHLYFKAQGGYIICNVNATIEQWDGSGITVYPDTSFNIAYSATDATLLTADSSLPNINHSFSVNNIAKTITNQDGKLGVGTKTPSEKLHVTGGKLYNDTQLLGSSNDTASTPSFSFKEDSNTGLFHASNATVGITTNGVERMRIDYAGNVGVGTTNPSYKLDVNGTVNATSFNGTTITSLSNLGMFCSNTAISASNTSITLSNYVYGTNTTNITNAQTAANWASNNLLNKSGGTVTGSLALTGNIDVSGTTTLRNWSSLQGNVYKDIPSYDPSLGDYSQFTISTSSNVVGQTWNAQMKLGVTNCNGGMAFIQSVLPFTGKQPLVFQPSGGNVGIGLSNPAYNLDVMSTININTTTNWGSGLIFMGAEERLFKDNTAGYGGLVAHISSSSNFLVVSTGGIVRMLVQGSSGNVGIGTASPSAKLHVAGDVVANNWIGTTGNTGFYNQTYGGGFYMTDTTWLRTFGTKNFFHDGSIMRTDGQLQIGDSGSTFLCPNGGDLSYRTNVLYANTSGNVGIGTTTPAYKLDVNGTINATTYVGTTITSLSNLGMFSSNASVSASNTVISLSNYVYGLSTTTTQTTANWASNAAVFGSNTSVWGSNNLVKKTGDTFTGNVGIGVSPSYTLDVNGYTRMEETYFMTDDLPFGATSTNRRYALLATVTSGNGFVRLQGIMGGHDSGTAGQGKCKFDITVDARNGTIRGNVANLYGANSSGIVVYQNNTTYNYTVYLTGKDYYRHNIQISSVSSTVQTSLSWSADTSWTTPTGNTLWFDTTVHIPDSCLGQEFYMSTAVTPVYGVSTLTNGAVGVGNSNPQHKMHINNGAFYVSAGPGSSGNALIASTAYGGMFLSFNQGSNMFNSASNWPYYGIGCSGNGILNIQGYYGVRMGDGISTTLTVITNKVGIGTTSPSYPLDVNGSAKFSGATAIYGNNIGGGGGILTLRNTATGNDPRWIFRGPDWGNNAGLFIGYNESTDSSFASGVNGGSAALSIRSMGSYYTMGVGTSTNSAFGLQVDASYAPYANVVNFAYSNINTIFTAGDIAGRYNGLAKQGDSIIVGYSNTMDVGGLVLGPWTTSGTKGIRIDGSTGNVGIATNNPQYTFDVAGTSRATTMLISPEFRSTSGAMSINSEFNITYTADYDGNNSGAAHIFYSYTNERMRITPSGNVGIGTNNPLYTLDVSGTINSTGVLSGPTITTLSNQGGFGSNTSVWTSNNMFNKSGGTISGNTTINNAFIGDTGFGTNFASFRHQSVPQSAYALLSDNVGSTYLNSAIGQPIRFLNSNVEKMTLSNGRLGIGTTTPQTTLDVNGAILCRFGNGLTSWSSNQLMFGFNGTSNYMHAINTRHNVLDDTGNSIDFLVWQSSQSTTAVGNKNIMSITSPGVGIFTSNPSYPLHVVGAIYASGDITAFSDARVKSNLQVIQSPLEKISHLTGYTYDMIDVQSSKTKISPKYTGIIAQELEKVLPEAIHKDDKGYMSIAYGNMAGLFVESIKALDEKNNILAQENQDLKAQLQTLASKIEDIEKRLR